MCPEKLPPSAKVRTGSERPDDGPARKAGQRAPSRGAPDPATARRGAAPRWALRLYVAGWTRNAVTALENLEQVCEEHLAGEYRLEVVDLLRDPRLARGDRILAVPTLVRQLPRPVKKIIGDLSSSERILVGLDLRQVSRTRRSA